MSNVFVAKKVVSLNRIIRLTSMKTLSSITGIWDIMYMIHHFKNVF